MGLKLPIKLCWFKSEVPYLSICPYLNPYTRTIHLHIKNITYLLYLLMTGFTFIFGCVGGTGCSDWSISAACTTLPAHLI